MPLFPTPAFNPSPASALFISTQEAADLLHVSPWTIRSLVKRGDLHAFTPVIGGKKFLLYSHEVESYARLAREISAERAERDWQEFRRECLQ